LNFIQHQQYLFIDDTYNANPTLCVLLLKCLSATGIKVMVMGDIGELGDAVCKSIMIWVVIWSITLGSNCCGG
jgi:UDP-N-acetylmuramyl pentapeptide synthase